MAFLLIWLLFGLASAAVASSKGRSGCGFFALGVLLGPFGLLFAMISSSDRPRVEAEAIRTGDQKECPACAELVKAEATKCRFCGESLA